MKKVLLKILQNLLKNTPVLKAVGLQLFFWTFLKTDKNKKTI